MLDKAEMRTRKGDFAVRILSFVEARENTGYFCKVKRQMDALERYDPQCNRFALQCFHWAIVDGRNFIICVWPHRAT